jgi:hypothetical protein
MLNVTDRIWKKSRNKIWLREGKKQHKTNHALKLNNDIRGGVQLSSSPSYVCIYVNMYTYVNIYVNVFKCGIKPQDSFNLNILSYHDHCLSNISKW